MASRRVGLGRRNEDVEDAAMAEISASMVMELRAKTDAPMMECKKALTEAGGDMEKAEELLRIKLGSKAVKAAWRVAAEGIVAFWSTPEARTGALVEVNCETDFVAKNEDFVAFGKELAELVAQANPADVAALSALRRSTWRDRRVARGGADRQDRREHVDPPLRARAAGRLASTCTARRSA